MTHEDLEHPPYVAGLAMANGHLQSIVPSVFRRVTVPFVRERLELDDGDFLLLDQLPSAQPDAPLVIISHGLEGNSRRPYVQGMARHFHNAGWHVYAWNFRGCGGEFNRLPRFYHSGAIDDLRRMIRHGIEQGFKHIFLVGFSMGGNQSVLTLAEPDLESEVMGGAAFSVPMDLAACSEQLAKPAQSIYMRRFLRDLKVKIADKAERFPQLVSLGGYDRLKTFKHFDDRYTAPLHGFDSAEDYWARCSSRAVLPKLTRPTLVVNALDDPFLAGPCYQRPAKPSPFLQLEAPLRGGHVGFMRWRLNDVLWSEKRALAFAETLLNQSHPMLVHGRMITAPALELE
ncbi:YheT family hydrolase [Saccharospirillum salsuginis]|uniref:Alpha/beta hydrolase n=1 Tax=Saccharospirillum salsuginis TaxID=418750 RepID=A0A918NDI8_9GAMM|nr:alpha/beta fold hydrolase [Saccharospirillum salsuginis]GGX62377.1 alpha/beta hydrolase [Saccharospirillum salsuginis]